MRTFAVFEYALSTPFERYEAATVFAVVTSVEDSGFIKYNARMDVCVPRAGDEVILLGAISALQNQKSRRGQLTNIEKLRIFYDGSGSSLNSIADLGLSDPSTTPVA